MRVVLSALCITALLGGSAAADKRRDDQAAADKAAAKRFYEEGTKYYSLRDFTRAVELYKKGFELSPSPVFLYNIAQAYRLLRAYDDALYFYKSYLRNSPDAANRDEVERRIAEMQTAIDQQKVGEQPPNEVVSPEDRPPPTPALPPRKPIPAPTQVAEVAPSASPVAPPPPPRERRPLYKKWWFWAGVGVVAVGATVAVVAATSGGASEPATDFGRGEVF